MLTKKTSLTLAAAVLGVVTAAQSMLGAEAASIAAPASAANATPAAVVDPADLVPHYRGGPATPADLAEMAKLSSLPALAPGAGEGDYQLKPPYAPAPEQTPRPDVPKGKVVKFTLQMADSKFYPNTGLRDWKPTRVVTVYIPSQYVPGTPAPLLLTQDAMGAGNNQLPTILDNMIADHRLPAMVAVMVANGGGDARGSERGLEYDTVSGKFAEFIEAEVLPRVAKDYGVTFTKDPEGRATMGGSSGGAAAFTMAWFHPELVSPRADLLRHLHEQPDAEKPRIAARRLGISRAPHPPEPARSPCASGWKSAKTTTARPTPPPTCTTGSSPTSAWPAC